ncbi:MAG: hypothetical protein ACREXX_24075, partial [Gammaproteobacteria bacterium]
PPSSSTKPEAGYSNPSTTDPSAPPDDPPSSFVQTQTSIGIDWVVLKNLARSRYCSALSTAAIFS